MKPLVLRILGKYLHISFSISILVFSVILPSFFIDDVAFASSPPKAYSDIYTTPKNTTLNVSAPGVLANDTDPEGDPLTASLMRAAQHGTISLSSDGSFNYTPDADYVGTDSFTYKANDGAADSNTATVTITVTSTNTPPVANADTYTTPKNTTLNVPAPGVLANDTDPEGDPLTASLMSATQHGTVSLSGDGSFTYTPDADYVGTDSFTYKANDGAADSNTATVTITVTSTNTPPVANADAYSTPKNTTLNISAPGVLANDTDPEGDPLTASLMRAAKHGTVSLSGDGSFTYTPDVDYVGTDSFTYKANDGTANSNTATVTITVTSTNAPPVANADTYTTLKNTTLNTPAPGVLANDIDPEGDPLTASLMSATQHGTVSLSGDGSFTYTPDADYVGTDSFTYKANDGAADSNTVTVTITVKETGSPGGGGVGGNTIIQEEPGVTKIDKLLDADGKFNQEVTALSDDNQAILRIESGTIAKTDGKPFTEITIKKTTNTKFPPKGISIVGIVYEFGPSGVIFDPKVVIKINYSPENIPEGVPETSLVIGYYDEKSVVWITLDSVVDTKLHSIRAQTGHLSLYTVLSGPITTKTTQLPEQVPTTNPIDLDTTTTLTLPPMPAAFVLSDVQISPVNIYIGESISISAIIRNIGDIAGTCQVILTVDNMEITTKNIYLSGGAIEIVTFNIVQDSVGRHTIDINGEKQEIEVKATPEDGTPKKTTWFYVIIGIGALLLSFSTTILVAQHKYR
jgi:VCBS repeat-containing protein